MKKYCDILIQIAIGLIFPFAILLLIFNYFKLDCTMSLDLFVTYISVIMTIISIIVGFEFTAISIIMGLMVNTKPDLRNRVVKQFLMPIGMLFFIMFMVLVRFLIFSQDKVVGNIEITLFFTSLFFLSTLTGYTVYLFYLLVTSPLEPKPASQ